MLKVLFMIAMIFVGENTWAMVLTDIECQTLTGDDDHLRLRYRGADPRENLGAPVALTRNGRERRASLFQSAVEDSTQRLYLEVVLDDERTATSDRVLHIIATWLGDRGNPAIASGTATDSIYDHRTGRVRSGPENRIQCLVERLE